MPRFLRGRSGRFLLVSALWRCRHGSLHRDRLGELLELDSLGHEVRLAVSPSLSSRAFMPACRLAQLFRHLRHMLARRARRSALGACYMHTLPLQLHMHTLPHMYNLPLQLHMHTLPLKLHMHMLTLSLHILCTCTHCL